MSPTTPPVIVGQHPDQQQATQHIVAVMPVAIVIDLTDAVGAAFYRQWERWNELARPGQKRWTLQEFIGWRISEAALGPGIDPGAAADWLERR